MLIGARGLRRAEVQFGKEVGEELSGAFAKRLRNSLPISAVIGRWGPEEFVAMLLAKKSEALASAKWITEHLSGAYACLKDGKTVRPDGAAHGRRRGDRCPRAARTDHRTHRPVPGRTKLSGLPLAAADRHLLHFVPALLQNPHHSARPHHVPRAYHDKRLLLAL